MFSYNLKEVFMARILPKWHYGFKDNSKLPFRIVLVLIAQMDARCDRCIFLLSELSRICDSSNVAQDVHGRKKEIMFNRKLELLVVRGTMSGRRFPISVNGSRLPRICDILLDNSK